MPEEKRFLVVLDGLRKEYARLELDLKNEVVARRRRTVPILLRVPEDLLERIEHNARKDARNRQNYILKVLSDAA
jgi:predicted DNA binding CopG/RHH family protein